jgi:hypothetical protein
VLVDVDTLEDLSALRAGPLRAGNGSGAASASV